MAGTAASSKPSHDVTALQMTMVCFTEPELTHTMPLRPTATSKGNAAASDVNTGQAGDIKLHGVGVEAQ